MEQVNAKRVVMFVAAACLIGMVVGSAVTFAVLNVQRAIPSTGLVVAVNVGVYSDSSCTLNLTSIDWGTVYPGGSVPRTVYVKNTGNAPITLSMTTASWNPAIAAGQINVTWDKENAVLNAGQATSAILTLSVSQNVSGVTSFSMNIIVAGSG
jgi:archaellum component FlaG (FlaF/FlaG flagellin family)